MDMVHVSSGLYGIWYMVYMDNPLVMINHGVRRPGVRQEILRNLGAEVVAIVALIRLSAALQGVGVEVLQGHRHLEPGKRQVRSWYKGEIWQP